MCSSDLFADAPDSDRLVDWGLRPTRPDWADGLRGAWTGTAAEALERFAAQGLAEYDTGRDAVGHDGTSRLSPYLASGEISARQVWEASLAVPGEGTEALRRELLWREFSIHQLSHNPALPESPARPAFAAMPWRSDPAALEAWRRGRTGVPIVDAGMRQLWRTGWMHNRARMIVASFLTKHLLIDWRAGQSWFWDTLVDADLANNAANWQWVAGCGADAAPYFRVFNPVLQGRKFDPDGAYVRTWVPELADMPARWIHAPWEAPATTAGYGPPIVDLGAGRARALAAFAGLRG